MGQHGGESGPRESTEHPGFSGAVQGQAPAETLEDAISFADAFAGGMDDYDAFVAIVQAFEQAKADYNGGKIGKAIFLAIKQQYRDAKRQHYGS